MTTFKVKAILKNQTGIEDWIKEKADYRLRRTGQQFVWPYNLGRWENWKQVGFLSNICKYLITRGQLNSV